jgi:hypothetical protein
MDTVQVDIAVSKTAQGFQSVLVEGLEVGNAMIPTGSGWFCRLPEVEVGPDGDVDIYVFAIGFPAVICTVGVKVGSNPERSKSKAFSAQGNAVFAFEEPVASASPAAVAAAVTAGAGGSNG